MNSESEESDSGEEGSSSYEDSSETDEEQKNVNHNEIKLDMSSYKYKEPKLPLTNMNHKN